MKRLAVAVPVYFNEGWLPPLVVELTWVEHELSRFGAEMQLIFVDDGSKDACFEELLKVRQQRPETIVIRLSRNFGAVHASKVGIIGEYIWQIFHEVNRRPEVCNR